MWPYSQRHFTFVHDQQTKKSLRIQTLGSGLHEVALTNHDLRQKVDNGVGRLVWVHLRKDVASISRCTTRLAGNEAEHPVRHAVSP